MDDLMLSDDNGTYSYAYDNYYNDRNNLTGTYYTPYYYNGYEDDVNSDSTTAAASSAADVVADDIPHGGLLLYDVDDDKALAALNALGDAALERTWVSQTLDAWSALYTAAFFGNATAAPSTQPQPSKPDAIMDGPMPFFEWYFGNASAAPSSRVALFYGVFFGNQSAPYTPSTLSAPVEPHDDKGTMVPQPKRRRLLHRPLSPSPSRSTSTSPSTSPRAGWGSFHLRGSPTPHNKRTT
jgi:hypothetical protein